MRLTLFAYSRTGCQTVRRLLAARREDSAVCYAAARLEAKSVSLIAWPRGTPS